jgi:PAP2 superfamily
MRKLLLIIISFTIAKNSFAQDSLIKKEEKLTYKCFIIPSALITTGLILRANPIQKRLQIDSKTTFGKNFHTKLDNYIQFAPAAQMLTGNLLGLESKHRLKQKIANLAISNILVGGVTFLAKSAAKDLRPDGSANNSFPSGHTATAFNNATLLFLEYKDSNIWYASSGFLFATATGALRVANNRHWSGDVAAGAGIGISIGLIVHYWNPFNFEKKENKKIGFIGYPIINDESTGIGLLCRIN